MRILDRRYPLSPEQVAALWICYEDGHPTGLGYRDEAERWLRQGNYMHKSTSPLSMCPEPARAKLIAEFTYDTPDLTFRDVEPE